MNDLFLFDAANTSFNLIDVGSHANNSCPSPRYSFGFAASPHGKVYAFGGKALKKSATASWVQRQGGFNGLSPNIKVLNIANDDLWEFDIHIKVWSQLSGSIYYDLNCDTEVLSGATGEPSFLSHYFCEDYAGMSHFALVYQPSGSLRFLGGQWSVPSFVSGGKLVWGEYNVSAKSWKLSQGGTYQGPTQTYGVEMTRLTGSGIYDGPPQTYGDEMTAVGDDTGRIFVLADLMADGSSAWERWVQGKWAPPVTTSSVTSVQGLPYAVTFFGASVCGGSLYFFGGGRENGMYRWYESATHSVKTMNNEASAAEPDTNSMSGGPPSTWVAENVDFYAWDQVSWNRTKWQVPFKLRYGHGMTSTDNQIFIYGGTYGNLDNTHPDVKDAGGMEWVDNRKMPMLGNSQGDPEKMGVKYGEICCSEMSVSALEVSKIFRILRLSCACSNSAQMYGKSCC